MPHSRTPILAALAVAVLTGAATTLAQSTWTTTTWSDPATGAELAAIATPIEFGPDGRGVFACEAEGPGGLTFALEAADFAAAPDGDVTMSYRMDMEPEVLGFATWTRSEDGTVVRFAGSSDELATLVEQMSPTVSPAFFWVVGAVPASDAEMEAAQAEGRVSVSVLESRGFGEALADLPCSP